MSEVDQARLYSTTRADVWAEEFAKVYPECDQGTMIGWFANAIETGRTAGYSKGYSEANREWQTSR